MRITAETTLNEALELLGWTVEKTDTLYKRRITSPTGVDYDATAHEAWDILRREHPEAFGLEATQEAP